MADKDKHTNAEAPDGRGRPRTNTPQTPLGERIEECLREKNMTALTAGTLITGKEKSLLIYNLLRGASRSLKAPDLHEASKVFGVHYDWLLNGTGEKYLQKGLIHIPQISSSELITNLSKIKTEGFLRHHIFSQSFINQHTQSDTDDLIILEARGDGMEPLIKNGDSAFIDITNKGRVDGIYGIVVGQHPQIRQVQFMEDKTIAKQTNSTYKDITITEQQIIGVVTFTICKFQ